MQLLLSPAGLIRNLFLSLLLVASSAWAEVTRIEVSERERLESDAVDYWYDVVSGTLYFALDPDADGNAEVADIHHAPRNAEGLVEFSADFKLMIPGPAEQSNGTLLYDVNNRGGSRIGPDISLEDPLASRGFTYLATGWIAELEPAAGRLRLDAPVVGDPDIPITGPVRYEVTASSPETEVDIAGGNHLAYEPTEAGLRDATLSYRVNQSDARLPVERSQFELEVNWLEGVNQPRIVLRLDGGFEPGAIYELVYEAKNPVLQGAGLAGIRDAVSLLRYGTEENTALARQFDELGLPDISHSIGHGISQSGRLLRVFLHDGFNADLHGRRVFDGLIPVIAGGGMGMFNQRFAMPTRTNGQHENHLFPNDLFPFTYGDSTDPHTGTTDGLLARSRATGTVPRVMHIQTANEYWIRAGSLAHTDPLGTRDAVIPEEVRFYTIGGAQHGSGSGIPGRATTGQFPRNPNMYNPITHALIVAMHNWVADDQAPPESRYPRIGDGTLVPSHLPDGTLNPRVWNSLPGANTPKAIYQPARADYGERFTTERIVDRHPQSATGYYRALVPAVNGDNNDFAHSTILPPLTAAPLATFMSWNLRAPATGAETEMLRLAGGYIPFAATTRLAQAAGDPRRALDQRYTSWPDYLEQYEAHTDSLVAEGFLLPDSKPAYMEIARANRAMFAE